MADVSTKETTVVTKTTKPKKVKKEKFSGFTVPGKRDHTKACIHMYEMIKEANPELLDREDVKKAYNDFVALCKTYDNLESWIPYKSYKYIQNIKLESESSNEYHLFKGLNFRWLHMYNNWNNPVLRKEFIDNTNIILNSYTILYELIKRDVVPYMERKEWERTKDKNIETYNNQIARYEDDIKAFEKTIKTYEKYITDTRAKICELAKKALNTLNPPEPTKFYD
jgi:di/tripeptidase